MAWRHDTMMNPPIEELFDRANSKFRLVTLASKRARQINSYFNQLGEGLGATVPPQVTSVARKPLSIAFEEIAADKIIPVEPQVPSEEELAEIEAAEIEVAEIEVAEAAGVEADAGDDGAGTEPSA